MVFCSASSTALSWRAKVHMCVACSSLYHPSTSAVRPECASCGAQSLRARPSPSPQGAQAGWMSATRAGMGSGGSLGRSCRRPTRIANARAIVLLETAASGETGGPAAKRAKTSGHASGATLRMITNPGHIVCETAQSGLISGTVRRMKCFDHLTHLTFNSQLTC